MAKDDQKIDLVQDLELDFETDVSTLQDVGGETIDSEEKVLSDTTKEEKKVVDEAEEEIDFKESSDESEEEEETGKEEQEEVEARVIDEVAAALGYDFDETELADIPDTPEGLTEFVRMSGERQAQSVIDKWMEDHPMTSQVLEYERAGGDPNKFREVFAPEIDYSDVKLSDDDIAQQKNIVRQSLKEKGFSDAKIKRNVELFEDNGILKEEAEDALKELKSVQSERKQQLIQEQKKKQAQVEQVQQEIMQQVEKSVKEKNAFAGIPLPEAEKTKFMKFLTEVDEEGYTPRDRQAAQVNMEENLAFDLLLYYGFDKLGKLMKNRSTTSGVRTLKERLDKRKPSSDTADVQPTPGDVDQLEFRIPS